MPTFYDRWLQFWEEVTIERRNARKCIHEEEIEWVSTPQDAKVGLLVSPETGFRTWGTEAIIAEIPAGWHTGKHVHGEEGTHIVEGEGFSVVNGIKYNWSRGSTLWIPFGAEHQHFNTGDHPARYYSIMTIHLEHFVGLAKLEQLAECGPTRTAEEVPVSATGLDSKGRRICLTLDQAPRRYAQADRQRPIEQGTIDNRGHDVQGPAGHHSMNIEFMRPKNGFQNMELELSGILSDNPHTNGGKHAHMEAILYILQGGGYSVVDGEKLPWKKGTCFHVQGPQTVHQHFNTSDEPSLMLRAAPGIREHFFGDLAKERFPRLWFEPGSAVPLTIRPASAESD